MAISIGVPQIETADVDHEAIIKRTDENLYKAKRKGAFEFAYKELA